MRINSKLAMFSLVGLLCLNCSPEEQTPNPQGEIVVDKETNNSSQKEEETKDSFGFSESPGLPSSSSTSNCTSSPEKLTLCEWFAASDAVVFGEIVDLKISTSPAEIMDGSNSITSDCSDGAVDPAIVISLSVETIITGDISVNDVIDIHVGSGEVSDWNPTILKNAQGEYDWNKPGGLAVGQKIGVPVTYSNTHNHWSNAMELLFTIDSNGLVQLQGHQEGSCSKNIPEGINSISLASIQNTAEACDFGALSNDKKQEKLAVWDNSPSHVSLAKCHKRLP